MPRNAPAPLVRFEHKVARKALSTKQVQPRAIRFKGDVSDLDTPTSALSLSAILKATRRDTLGARKRALLRAYDTGCRRSEFAAMQIADIDGPDAEGAGVVEIGGNKIDREGPWGMPTARAIPRP